MKWLQNLVAKVVGKKIKEDKRMKRVIEFLQGRKSYIVLAVGVAAGIAQSLGYPVPEWGYALLGGLLGVTFKAGQNRAEGLVKDLATEIKSQLAEAAKPEQPAS